MSLNVSKQKKFIIDGVFFSAPRNSFVTEIIGRWCRTLKYIFFFLGYFPQKKNFFYVSVGLLFIFLLFFPLPILLTYR